MCEIFLVERAELCGFTLETKSPSFAEGRRRHVQREPLYINATITAGFCCSEDLEKPFSLLPATFLAEVTALNFSLLEREGPLC